MSAVRFAGCPAGEQPDKQDVQPIDRLGAGFDDVVAVLDQCTQHGDRFVDSGRA